MSDKIPAKDVMALRQRTGLGMMDCKKALVETDGDMDTATELLFKSIKGRMDDRTDRSMAEGRLAIKVADDRSAVAIVELNTETDFTARNDLVTDAANKIVEIVLAGPAGSTEPNDEITSIIDNIRITTGENTTFKRGLKLEGACCGFYLHHDNQKGALVQLSGDADKEVLSGICQHITAIVPRPQGVDENDVDQAILDKVRAEAKQEAIDAGKPEEIAEKMVAGKLRKFLQEITLVNQKYIRDPDGKMAVKDALPKDVKVEKFTRYQVGVE